MPAENNQIKVTGHSVTTRGKIVTVHGSAEGVHTGNGNTGAMRRLVHRAANEEHTVKSKSGQHKKTTSSRIAPTALHPLKPKPAIYTSGNFRMAERPFDYRSGWELTVDRPLLTELSGMIALSSAADDWTQAAQQGINFILLVVKNNPKKTLATILKRKDVQQALQLAANSGLAAVTARLQEVWAENGGPTPSDYLESVLSDMARNAETFPRRMTLALSEGDKEQVYQILQKDRLRVAAAEAVLATRARAEAALNSITTDKVMWVAHVDAKTCPSCLELNGKMVDLGDEFDKEILLKHKLKPYGDLVGPPAHPNCRCILVPVPDIPGV